MATSQQAQAPAALAGTTAADITGYIAAQNANIRLVVRVASDGPFRLNLLATANPDTPTNYVVKQVSSSTVTVDGATAGYVNVAQIEDVPWPVAGKLQIYNPGVGSINWVADWRLYE